MLEIGRMNTLKVNRLVEFGAFLAGDETYEEILLPQRYMPKGCQPGDDVRVFVYFDSEDRIIATTETPLAMLGEFALLRVAQTTGVGAFLSWGLSKDVLVPFREQNERMRKGQSYLVYLYFDEQSHRIVASSRLDRYLDKEPARYKPGEKVDLIVRHRTELGYHVIINNRHRGFIFKEDVFQSLKYGQPVTGYIKRLRDDGKIDVLLQKQGYEKVDVLSKKILKALLDHDGFLPLTDKSAPQEISAWFKVSKKTFKKAVGALYKRRAIEIKKNGIMLTKGAEKEER